MTREQLDRRLIDWSIKNRTVKPGRTEQPGRLILVTRGDLAESLRTEIEPHMPIGVELHVNELGPYR